MRKEEAVAGKMKNIKNYLLALVLILIIFASAFFVFKYFKNSSGSENPNDKEKCEARGGIWGRVGLSPQERCNLPTTDKDKICTDNSDCEGTCFAEKTGENEYIGKCSGRKINMGCIDFLENGVPRTICFD